MFLCKALQHMQKDPSVELHVCFKRSYDEVLRHHHTFIVRSLAIVRRSVLLLCADVWRAWSIGSRCTGSGRGEGGSLASGFHCAYLAGRGPGEIRCRARQVAGWAGRRRQSPQGFLGGRRIW